MAIINVPAPRQVPGIGTAIGQGLQNFLVQRQRTQQQQALQQFAQQQGLNIPQGLPPSLISGLLGQQTQPFTLGAGQQRFSATGQPIAATPPVPQKFDIVDKLIDDPNSPTGFSVQQFNQRGQQIGARTATRKEVLQGVPEGALQKPTQTKIEKDIIDLDTTLTELNNIEGRFNEDFFTFRGKVGAEITSFFEKAEIPTGKKRQQFLKSKTAFFADSKRVFLKFRKFITGVAGGIQEFREIAKATIDPESDSPTEFTAKLNSMRDNAQRTRNVLLAIRNSGLDPNNRDVRKQAFSGLPLNNIPLEVPPDITLDQLKTGQQATQQTGFTSEQIEAELRRRGL